MPPRELDLSSLLKGQVSVIPEEHPEDRSARLRSEHRAALIEDCKGIAVFLVMLAGLAAVGVLSAYEGFFDTAASAETRRWSQTVLSSLVTGAVSFVVGRRMGR